jgi:hypothetical protein
LRFRTIAEAQRYVEEHAPHAQPVMSDKQRANTSQ